MCHLLEVIIKEKQAAYRLSIKNDVAFGKACRLLFQKLKDSRSLRSLENLPSSLASKIVGKTHWREILSPAGDIFSSLRNKTPGYLHFYLLTWRSIQRLKRALICLFYQYICVLLNLFLSTALSFSPGHGFGSSKMSRAQTFPSYAPEQSEETQQSLSRSSSYGFSYSSSLIQWHTENHCWPERQSVLDLPVGSLCPLPPGRPIAVEIEMGWV